VESFTIQFSKISICGNVIHYFVKLFNMVLCETFFNMVSTVRSYHYSFVQYLLMFNIFLKSGERQINDLLRAYALCAKIPAGPTEREQEQNWRTVKNQTGGLVEEREGQC
jgi:hypothetical protein